MVEVAIIELENITASAVKASKGKSVNKVRGIFVCLLALFVCLFVCLFLCVGVWGLVCGGMCACRDGVGMWGCVCVCV